jgi:hypothetical protein
MTNNILKNKLKFKTKIISKNKKFNKNILKIERLNHEKTIRINESCHILSSLVE